MASVAPCLEQEPWNRVRIPSPGSLTTVIVEDKDGVIGSCIKAVMKKWHSVRMSLMRKDLDTETSVLRAILYSNHNKLCHHKPYLALKQVEQCLKRMKCVNLEGSIQDLVELCPNREDKLENTTKYIIPSQPVVEFVLMKILGTCKLILRLLNCCCKTFFLSVKHLCLEEFIILNTVITGLVSRIWVLYKDALKKLVFFYKPLFQLLQKISRIQPMPYFKNFIFPAELIEFLGEDYLYVFKKNIVNKGVTKLLNKLFLAKEKSNKPIEEIALKILPKSKQMKIKITDNVDIGKAVQKRKIYRETSGFDLKAFCKRSKHKAIMDTSFKSVCSERRIRKAIDSSQPLITSSCAKNLVLRIRKAQSFTQLSEELQMAIFWCKSRKLKHKVTFLRNKLLKSNRLKHVEAQGCSLPKKLNCIKTSICNFLLHGLGKMSSKRHLRRISSQNKFMKQQRKPQRKLQPAVLKEIQQFLHQTEKVITKRDAKETFSDLKIHRPEMTSKKRQLLDNRNANLIENCSIATKSPTLTKVKENNTVAETVRDMDDIDDIFSSLGV